ncbi:hypothetical protein [Methanosphaera sp. BMS]|uniref:hypothetical protein n=1 Tax=Methanosphaera sp. BMS TaxID=1789762 RepID=UPI000DC1EAC5|nr:hypothetical protein [Methanosphaera sp. BMS]AWX32980.1 hypothetical protein AW729_07655 [Methanosphaera sp. BMS]
MSKKNNKKVNDSLVDDPLDELNEMEDTTFTIERENDVFDELEIRDAESIPEYNSESGMFIETDEGLEKFVNEESSDDSDSANDGSKKNSQDAVKIMDVIDEVDINNPDNSDKLNTKRVEQEAVKASQEADRIAEKSDELSKLSESHSKVESSGLKDKVKKSVSSKVKSSDELVITKDSKKTPKIRVKPKLTHGNKKSDTKVVDNVKVDEDGVPLLNQFDTEKIKNTSFYHKLHLNKRNLTQIALILAGFLIIIYGIIQAFEEVAKISDNVMYGEHASLSIGIIFIGMIIIVLAFYKEIINLFGLGNMYNTMDSNNSKKDDKKHK